MRVGETQTVSFVVEQHALSNTHSNSSFSNVFDRDPDRLGSSQLSIELSHSKISRSLCRARGLIDIEMIIHSERYLAATSCLCSLGTTRHGSTHGTQFQTTSRSERRARSTHRGLPPGGIPTRNRS